MKAYKLRFACGNSGYQELLNQGYPLPSIRTLTRKLENLKFEPGLIDEVFDFLNIKISHFKKDTDKDCILILDEMCITSGIFYDNSSKKCIGKVTLPDNNKQEACQALVIMLAGIASRWKQIVAYHFTTKTLKGVDLKDIVDNVIKKGENLGLRIYSITSDIL